MAQKFQITQVDSDGSVKVLHPESNADYILAGKTFKVATIEENEKWNARALEIENARKGEENLLSKIDKIDNAITASALLESIKTVDGAGSKLDADTVDGKNVNNSLDTDDVLWTALKVKEELNKKSNADLVSKTPQANKLLLLNNDGKFSVDINGNADTATSWGKATAVRFSGDVQPVTLNLQGNETSQLSVNLSVVDDSHNHTNLTNGNSSIEVSTSNIINFKSSNKVVSSIDSNGNFTGSSKKVGGYEVDDNTPTKSIWTSGKIGEEIVRAISESAKLNQDTGTITLGNGVIKIKYGKATITNQNTVNITFNEAFTKVLFDSFSLESSDTSVVCSKVANSLTTSGVRYQLNKSLASGAITWFVVGV